MYHIDTSLCVIMKQKVIIEREILPKQPLACYLSYMELNTIVNRLVILTQPF